MGDIFIFTPGTLHALRQAEGQCMEYENIILSWSFWAAQRTFVREISASAAKRALVAACAADPERFVLSAGRRLPAGGGGCNRAKLPGYELQVKGALLRFLALLLAQGRQRLAAETADTQRLKTLLQCSRPIIPRNSGSPMPPGVCSFSASHFMRWFRQMTGQSFVAFLNEYRLNAAAEALQPRMRRF